MDMIDYELKRYETMQNDLETRRNPDFNGRPKSDTEKTRDQSKSADFLDTLMNEEKPRDVSVRNTMSEIIFWPSCIRICQNSGHPK